MCFFCDSILPKFVWPISCIHNWESLTPGAPYICQNSRKRSQTYAQCCYEDLCNANLSPTLMPSVPGKWRFRWWPLAHVLLHIYALTNTKQPLQIYAHNKITVILIETGILSVILYSTSCKIDWLFDMVWTKISFYWVILYVFIGYYVL